MWPFKQKTLGKYVKYSKHTAQANRNMVSREYDHVISSLRRGVESKIIDINRRMVEIYVTNHSSVQTAQTQLDVGWKIREGQERVHVPLSETYFFSEKNPERIRFVDSEVYKGIKGLKKLLIEYEKDVSELKELERKFGEACDEHSAFQRMF